MSVEKVLGKIDHVRFGFGGYQDAMIGVTFSFSMNGSGIGDFWGDWSIKRSEGSQWSEEDRINRLGKTVMRINELLKQAKVDDIMKLQGIPVEVTLHGNSLKSWRILEEVL